MCFTHITLTYLKHCLEKFPLHNPLFDYAVILTFYRMSQYAYGVSAPPTAPPPDPYQQQRAAYAPYEPINMNQPVKGKWE